MRLQFWGTRGSLAKPGPSTIRYGGNTSCVEMRSSRGTLIIIDCGTGAYALGQSLLAANPKGIRGHILISHTHWDHIQGLPFFAPLFVPGNEWDVYGPVGLDESMREALSGQMQYTYFPVTMEQFGATVRYHDLVEGDFRIDDVGITTHYLNHPALTLGYRLEADGATVVYSCDHEPYSRALAGGVGEITGHDERHAAFLRGADLVIHDAQYTAQEYPAKIGWGHSPVEYAVRMARHAGVPKIALTHHDPARDDNSIDRIVESLRSMLLTAGSTLEVCAAAEGQSIEVTPSIPRRVNSADASDRANTAIDFALEKRFVTLAVSNPASASIIAAAVKAEHVPLRAFSDPGQIAGSLQTERPSLVILEHNPPIADGIAICRAIRQVSSADIQSLPVIMIADREDTAGGEAAGVTEWITRPFTSALVRTKIRAWILRTACRWKQAPVPADEERRLAALESLAILDTGSERRFDRLTRLAAALFDVPIAMINLVGRERTWFKSCVGTNGKLDSPRESSFCAHVVYSRAVMIVPDMLRDPRFADNPLVVGDPHVRFYAGAPLILDDGSCVGTLCLIDTRARALEGLSIKLLEDLRDLALQELEPKDHSPSPNSNSADPG
jgi:phosphoribosyl 1,2-cyclic phosphodiesterase/DNA-binding response OmpR family regulator